MEILKQKNQVVETQILPDPQVNPETYTVSIHTNVTARIQFGTQTRSAAQNANFTNIEAGTYDVTISADGYQTITDSITVTNSDVDKTYSLEEETEEPNP